MCIRDRDFSRRHLLLTGLGFVVTGCTSTASSRRAASDRPGPLWPEGIKPPTPGRYEDSAQNYRPIHRAKGGLPTRTPAAANAALPSGVLPRKNWTRHGVAANNINPMNGVRKITIHHEGWTPFTGTSLAATYDRIESIRQIHTRDRGWADIGYHFVIDRKGRVIEGRSLSYQGAHVSENNPHNLGIVLLGNFDQQKPTADQIETLGRFTRQMVIAHNVPSHLVRTHREINPTICPGKHLQGHIDRLRHRGVFAA